MHRSSALLSTGLLAACFAADVGSSSDTASTGDTSSATEDDGSATNDEGSTEASTDADDASIDDTAGSTAADTGGAQDLGPCGRVAACIDARDEIITPFLSVYGEDGTCWTEFTTEQCWQDCRAMFDAYGAFCDEAEECCECTEVAHCDMPESDACIDGECVPARVPTGCSQLMDACDSATLQIQIFSNTCLGSDCPAQAEALAACLFEHDPETACDEVIMCMSTTDCSTTDACALEATAFGECLFAAPR